VSLAFEVYLTLLKNAELAFWDENVVLVLLERNAGVNLACRTDCFCSIFELLSTSAASSLMFSIFVKPHGLLGTPGNLKFKSLKRKRMAELVFTVSLIVCHHFRPAGVLRDVDACSMGCTKSGTLYIMSSGASYFRSNLRRDSKASLRRDVAENT